MISTTTSTTTTTITPRRRLDASREEPSTAQRRRLEPDIAAIRELERDFPVLRGGMDRRHDTGRVTSTLDVEEIGETGAVTALGNGEALKLEKVGETYALCAIGGTTLRDATGRQMKISAIFSVALLGERDEIEAQAKDAVEHLLKDMVEQGAHDIDLFVVGGAASLIAGEGPGADNPAERSLANAGCLLAAARDASSPGIRCRLRGALVGVSQTPEREVPQPGQQRLPSTGRPDSITVYVTRDEVFYVHDEPRAVSHTPGQTRSLPPDPVREHLASERHFC